jgi:hypothetical protein
MTLYIPENPDHRRLLADSLRAMLTKAGFTRQEGLGEEQWHFKHKMDPRCVLVCYTSIYRGEVREVDKDAIRFVMLFAGEPNRAVPLFRTRRVNRTGSIEDISERALARLREVYQYLTDQIKAGKVCQKCKAPLHQSKKGNEVCAAACWVKQPANPFGV